MIETTASGTKDQRMKAHTTATVLLLALLLHEAATDAAKFEKPINPVPFADLSATIQQSYSDIASNLLAVVEPWCPATSSEPYSDAVDWMARHISDAALRAGVNDEGIAGPFDGLSPEAQAFRRRQATYLLARFGFRDAPALGARGNGDPDRQPPPR